MKKEIKECIETLVLCLMIYIPSTYKKDIVNPKPVVNISYTIEPTSNIMSYQHTLQHDIKRHYLNPEDLNKMHKTHADIKNYKK